MTKSELIKNIANETEMSKKDVEKVLTSFQNVVKQGVSDGEKVSITGFIAFDKKHIDAKTGISRLGKDGKAWSTPEKDVISVKLSKSYKEL